MGNRLLSAAGIAALLSVGVPAHLDACLFSASNDHACCAERAAEIVDACCASSSGSDRANSVGCGCLHAPDIPVVTTSPAAPTDPCQADHIAHPDARMLGDDRAAARSDRPGTAFRAHSPPPVFLLDCAFLI